MALAQVAENFDPDDPNQNHCETEWHYDYRKRTTKWSPEGVFFPDPQLGGFDSYVARNFVSQDVDKGSAKAFGTEEIQYGTGSWNPGQPASEPPRPRYVFTKGTRRMGGSPMHSRPTQRANDD